MSAQYIKDIHYKFLTALSKLEERTDEGTRRIDSDQGFLDKCVAEAKEYCDILLNIRYHALYKCEKGDGKIKPEIYRGKVVEKCKEDIIYWINNWTWTFNPFLTKYGFPARLPMVLYEKQEEYVRWREDLYRKNKSGVVFKCRAVGVSWVNTIIQCWHFHFEESFQGRFGSRVIRSVDDKSNPDTLFWKIRENIYGMPFWMRHKELYNRENKYDTLAKIINPANGSVISGEGGDRMGRGGRASMYDCDEWASVEHSTVVESALSKNCPCRFYTSTPEGPANDFAQKIQKRGQPNALPVFDFCWWDDPRNSQDWYKNQRDEFAEEVVAQEIDRSLNSFVIGTAIPTEWVAASKELYKKIKSGDIQYKPDCSVVSLDVAAGGKNRSVLEHRAGIVIEECLEYNIDNSTELARMAATYAEDKRAGILCYDPIGVGHGVRSTFDLEKFDFRPVAVDARKAASSEPLEGDTRPAHDRCINRRSELCERLRLRFQRTYEYIAKGIDHPIETMIAICNNDKLASQLSLPSRLNTNGKWRLEDKESMVKRGVDSPDYFDATMYCFADEINEVRVIRAFNPKASYIINDDFPIKLHVYKEHAQHYISIYHKGTSVGVVGGVWIPPSFIVYADYRNINATVNDVWMTIGHKFYGNVHKYVGNKEMFSKDQEDLFMQYLSAGVLLQENFFYNELSSYSTINEMFDRDQVKIMRGCKSLLGQLDSFIRTKGTPDKSGMEVVLALCSIANWLREYKVIRDTTSFGRSYYRDTSRVNTSHEMGIV